MTESAGFCCSASARSALAEEGGRQAGRDARHGNLAAHIAAAPGRRQRLGEEQEQRSSEPARPGGTVPLGERELPRERSRCPALGRDGALGRARGARSLLCVQPQREEGSCFPKHRQYRASPGMQGFYHPFYLGVPVNFNLGLYSIGKTFPLDKAAIFIF